MSADHAVEKPDGRLNAGAKGDELANREFACHPMRADVESLEELDHVVEVALHDEKSNGEGCEHQ